MQYIEMPDPVSSSASRGVVRVTLPIRNYFPLVMLDSESSVRLNSCRCNLRRRVVPEGVGKRGRFWKTGVVEICYLVGK